MAKCLHQVLSSFIQMARDSQPFVHQKKKKSQTFLIIYLMVNCGSSIYAREKEGKCESPKDIGAS